MNTYQELFDRACGHLHKQAFIAELDRQIKNEEEFGGGTSRAGKRASTQRLDDLKRVRFALSTVGYISDLYHDCGTFVVALGAASRALGIDRARTQAFAKQWDAEHAARKD